MEQKKFKLLHKRGLRISVDLLIRKASVDIKLFARQVIVFEELDQLLTRANCSIDSSVRERKFRLLFPDAESLLPVDETEHSRWDSS